MALTHLLAAAACGWWLAMGERALWRLVELTARGWSDLAAPALRRWAVALRAMTVCTLRVGLLVPAVVDVRRPPQQQIIDRSVLRRGPPRAA